MATIGTFSKTEGGYTGRITTLTLDLEVTFRPSPKEHEKAPDFRVIARGEPFGAAWQRVSAAEREYLSCKLDDPLFPAPIYASLVLSDDGETYILLWTR